MHMTPQSRYSASAKGKETKKRWKNENRDKIRAWRNKNRDKVRAWKLKWATSENGKTSQRRYRAKSPKALRFLYIASAERRGLLFDVSEGLFTELINGDCIYCGQSAKEKRNGIKSS